MDPTLRIPTTALRTILLVDDDADGEALTLKAIERSGIPVHVRVARNGHEALAAFAVRSSFDAHQRPALVLLDLRMPDMDGVELLTQLRTDPTTRLVPVVLLTSYQHSQTISQAYRLGASGYVLKRGTFGALCEDMRVILKYWLEVAQLPASRPPEVATETLH